VELATGKPLWDCDLGNYPEQYNAAASKLPVKEEDKEGVQVGTPLYDPLTVIGGVLMVEVATDGLYAFDTSNGKELWRSKGIARTPSPVKVGTVEYALCSGSQDLQLVEPKSGKGSVDREDRHDCESDGNHRGRRARVSASQEGPEVGQGQHVRGCVESVGCPAPVGDQRSHGEH
jgi:hypothetical protein